MTAQLVKITTQTFNYGEKRTVIVARKLRIQVIPNEEEEGVIYLKDANGTRITPLIYSLSNDVATNSTKKLDYIEISLPCGSPFEYLLDVDFNGREDSVYLSILIYP